MNWPSFLAAAGLPGPGGADSTHTQLEVLSFPPPPHCAVRRMADMTPEGTLQLLAFELDPDPVQPPRRKSPVREETP
jgi:hypothetical protein